MQLGAAGMGGRKSNEDDPDSNRPFWRPRKSSKPSRRRRMMRRRRPLENDVAELAANAGPGHNEAIRNTRLIANQVRHMLGQCREIDDRAGMRGNESNNMQAAMAARGDPGALLLLAGTAPGHLIDYQRPCLGRREPRKNYEAMQKSTWKQSQWQQA